MHLISKRYALIALLILGSATLLFSCGKRSKSVEYDLETLMTESSENRTIVMIEDGKCSYTFWAPLIEGYSMAKNPYQEFRRGIKLTTYSQDTITVVADTVYVGSQVDVVITANYAIHYEKQQLWEAKGDVVVIKHERERGDTLVKSTTEVYTQQLFWDARTKKIYSNVDTKVLQPDGWHFGVGFEADEDLKNIHFRKYKSEMEFDFSPVEEQEESVEEPKRADAKKDDVKRIDKDSKKEKRERPKSNDRPGSRKPSPNREFNPSSMSTKESVKPVANTRPELQSKNVEMSSAVDADFSMSQSKSQGRDAKSKNFNRGKSVPTGTIK
jgi:hypothetical protein